MSKTVWDDPDLSSEDFKVRVGTSLFTEFAVGHSPADVLRELVQNEYDAGGTSLDVEFGSDALTITGSGKPIDSTGWTRLSVMLGTGVVAGEAEQIRPKANGIGSKNFGLRSLFLFGDRIYVYSAGNYTVLDRLAGALPRPRTHEASADTKGVIVRVPYRLVNGDGLRAFDDRYEREAITNIAVDLAPTLIKLALPGSAKSVRSVVVRFQRLDREIIWRQTVRELPKQGGALKRSVRIEQRGTPLPDVPKSISEIEYRRVVLPPAELRGRDMPSYFRAGAGKVRLGVSFQTKGGRLDRSAVGTFFYPLGARRSRTGFPFSVSAPFEMNEDRSQIVDVPNSDWNAWLIDESARFVTDLLEKQLFKVFGVDAYLALVPASAGAATVAQLPEAIKQRLSNEPCWPSQATRGRSRRPVFASLTSVIVAADTSLTETANAALAQFVDQNINAAELLHSCLASAVATRLLAKNLGAASFTLNSLIRLRCAGQDANALATKLKDTEAGRVYTEFPGALADLGLQVSFASALKAAQAQLSDHNRSDLGTSPTTLTAAGTLKAPDVLWVVDEVIASVVPADTRLHPDLSKFEVLAKLCKRFNASTWAAETAGRLADGVGTEVEREALLRYIRGQPVLSAKTWAALRRAPILPDHRGERVAPMNIVLRSTPGARYVEPALHYLTPQDEENRALDRFRLRKALVGNDLVAMARLVEAGDVAPGVMREALVRLTKLLTPTVVRRLHEVSFLETASGSVVAPAEAYVRTDRTVSALGEDAPYAVQLPPRLLERLRCRTDPSVDDIVAGLQKRRESGAVPPNPELIYRALHEAARAERRPASEHRLEPILWTGAEWVAPDECLVGSDHRAIFLDVVTVLHGPLRDTYIALGAHPKPDSAHWCRLFERIGADHGSSARVPLRAAAALIRAYTQLHDLPNGLPATTPCFLDEHGGIHPRTDVIRSRFLIDDDPALAAKVRESGAPVSFAKTSDPRVLPFLRAAGVQPLSAVAKPTRTIVGTEVLPHQALQLDDIGSRLREPHFASALVALSSALCDPDKARTAKQLAARLRKLERIVFVTEVRRQYRIAGTNVDVRVDHDLQPDKIILSRVDSQHELRALARAVAAIADPKRGEQLLSDPVYFLLQCRSTEDMRRELERRKIPWRPDPTLAWNDESEDNEAASTIADAVGRAVVESAFAPCHDAGSPPRIPAAAPVRTQRRPLPDLILVSARQAVGTGSAPQKSTNLKASRGAPTRWAPRTQEEREEDSELGRRGEEIVLRRERERITALGLPAERVVWTADTQPAADHDIKSVDDDGEDLWIEVKATTGRDGRFSWPSSEFQLAVRKRERYVLCRVYEADTVAPTLVDIRDPVGRFQVGELRLDLDSLAVDIGPLTNP